MGGTIGKASIWVYALVISVVAALVYAFALYRKPRRFQVVATLMLAGWGWSVLKDSFVSGDHYPGFFRIVSVAVALVCLCGAPRQALAGAVALGGNGGLG
jgi:lipoprotein signal peptidase